MVKTCSTCKIEKSKTEFYKRLSKKDGLYNNCIACTKEYNVVSHLKNRIARLCHKKIHYQNNKIEIAKNQAIYISNNKEKIAKRVKLYSSKHKEDIKIYRRKYDKDRRKTDPAYKLQKNLRRRFLHVLSGRHKSESVIKLLGCDVEFLKKYLEAQFTITMSWDNYGIKPGYWSIDHIIPFSSIDVFNISELQKICHYTNLRPLLHIDNIKKSNK